MESRWATFGEGITGELEEAAESLVEDVSDADIFSDQEKKNLYYLCSLLRL